MTDDDPVPLKAGGEATPELVRALYALGKRGPDAARLARVADKLAATLAEPPPPGAANGVRKLLGTKLITGIVIGLGGLGWLGYHLVTQHEAPAKPPRPAAVEISQDRPAVTPPTASDRPVRNPLADAAPAMPPPSAAGRSKFSSAPRSVRRAAPVASTRRDPSDTTQSQSVQPSPASALAPTAVMHTDTNATAEPEKPEPKPAVQPAPRPAESVAQRSEVELLFDARKAMPSQPAAALRSLDEHATRFPNGMLSPEREVLRIEALRKLDRTAEATQRLHQFEARYPESIHLRRLQTDSSNQR